MNNTNKIWVAIGAIIVLILAIFAYNALIIHQNNLAQTGVEDMINSGTTSSNVRLRGPEEKTLKVGQSEDVSGVHITLNDFLSDNRCDVDQKCSEVGSVTVNTTLQAGDQLVTRNFPQDEAPFEIGGYKVSIVKVAPDRVSGQFIEDADYQITFRVETVATSTENI